MRGCAALLTCLLLCLCSSGPATESATVVQRGWVRTVRFQGLKRYPSGPLVELSGLRVGAPIDIHGVEEAARSLLETGLFAYIHDTWLVVLDQIDVTFTVEEAPTIPVTFDNFPWFSDAELTGALELELPLFDGTAPPTGSTIH